MLDDSVQVMVKGRKNKWGMCVNADRGVAHNSYRAGHLISLTPPLVLQP